MINKSIKEFFNEKIEINSISNLNLNLRPSNINPEIYYRITELYEKK